MWLYTKIGFFSVVQKPPCKPDELLIRSRCITDIELLHKQLIEKFSFTGTIMKTPRSDYAYRMVVPRNIFADFMSDLIKNLSYENFKNTIPKSDRKRHDAYLRCWEAMWNWQNIEK